MAFIIDKPKDIQPVYEVENTTVNTGYSNDNTFESTARVLEFDDLAARYEKGLDNLKSNDDIKSEAAKHEQQTNSQAAKIAETSQTSEELADIAALNKSIANVGSDNIASGISLVTSFAASLISKSDKALDDKYKIDAQSQKNISTAIKLLAPKDKPMMSPWLLVVLSIAMPMAFILFRAWQDRKIKDENERLKKENQAKQDENERLKKENETQQAELKMVLEANEARKARIKAKKQKKLTINS